MEIDRLLIGTQAFVINLFGILTGFLFVQIVKIKA